MIALSLRRDVGPFLCCDKNITITTKAAYRRKRFVVLVFVVAQATLDCSYEFSAGGLLATTGLISLLFFFFPVEACSPALCVVQ